MANLYSKAYSLFKTKKYKDLLKKTTAYIRYLFIKFWFNLTLKEMDSNLKKTNKDWIIFTYLKTKYEVFLKNYKKQLNETHEYSNIIWWCWFQGEENAPELCKTCLASIRREMPDKEIRIITTKNMFDYVDFPDFIKEKYKKGIITNTHFSDLLRLELLIKYGGTWIDSTVYCTNKPDYAFNIPLFVFKTNERNDPGIAAQSWFISSEKKEPILTLTRDLLYKYWEKHNYMIHYFLIYFFVKLASEFYKDEWEQIPWFPDLPPHIMQRELNKPYTQERWNQLCRMSDIHKLSYKIELDKNIDNFYRHIIIE